MKIAAQLSILTCTVLLTACGPSLEDAQKLGFESVGQMKSVQKLGYQNKEEWDKRYVKLGFESLKQMEELNARGYQTMQAFKNVRALDPNYFYTNCKRVDEATYNANCKGKKISWFGEINSASTSYGANIKVTNNDGTALENSFTIDSKSLASKISKTDEGKLVEFDGIVGAKNVVSPDIESITYTKLESLSEKQLRSELIKEVEKKKAEVAEKEAAEELSVNGSDAKWLDSKYGIAAAISCSSGADNFLRSTAKFAFKWDDIGWLETKFDSYYSKITSPGVITYTSSKVALQNGFGAYQRIKIACDYDVLNKKVINYWIN